MQNLSFFNSQFTFFQTLPPNTDVHYSPRWNSFIVTGGSLSFLPGAQTAANIYKGHSNQGLTKDLNQLTSDLHKNLNERLVYIYSQNFGEEYISTLDDLQNLKEEFEKAITGIVPDGGINGLKAWQDVDTQVKVDQFIRRTRKIITSTQQLLICEKAYKDKVTKEDSALLESISGSEVGDHMDRFLPENLLHSIALLEKEEEESRNVSYTKSALFNVTLGYNALMNIATNGWDWWNEISLPDCDAKIFLGALPISRTFANLSGGSSNDLATLTREHGITAVLSVVEQFEMNANSYLKPISANQWREEGITHKQLPAEDFKNMSIEQIEEGVDFIHSCIESHLPIYIHCKAGRGRSALVLSCYLIKYHGFTAEEAISHIQKFRPQAKLESSKMDTAKSYENICLFRKANEDKQAKSSNQES